MRSRLSPTRFRLVYVSNVTLVRRDFYRQVFRALGLAGRGTPAALFEAIRRDVETPARRASRLSRRLDEAHLMPDQTLAHLHVLANFDWDGKPLLSMVLVGLPELHNRLGLSIYRLLLTRIGACIEIEPVSADQTAAFVRKRLDDAGAKADLFTPDALVPLHENTGGVLRSVDVLADASLRIAAQREIVSSIEPSAAKRCGRHHWLDSNHLFTASAAGPYRPPFCFRRPHGALQG